MSMRMFSPATVMAYLMLCSCAQAPVSTAADNQRVDAAMAKVVAEQARTDRAEARKRHETALLYEKSLKLPEDQRGITAPPR